MQAKGKENECIEYCTASATGSRDGCLEYSLADSLNDLRKVQLERKEYSPLTNGNIICILSVSMKMDCPMLQSNGMLSVTGFLSIVAHTSLTAGHYYPLTLRVSNEVCNIVST